MLDEQVKLIEYDTRDGASQNAGKKEGYYIIKDITKEDDYKQLFDTTETEEISPIGSIFYWESTGFVWK